MIYLGYFEKIDEYERNGLTPVSIAGCAPEGYHGFEYRKLAPKKEWWQKWHDEGLSEEWYTNYYKETVIDKLSAKDVYHDLERLGDKVVLLCYEKPGQFCHRNLVAEWFRKNGLSSEEYHVKGIQQMDKNKIKEYDSDKDATAHVADFEGDWEYDPVDYVATHKTGLKLFYEEDENGKLNVVCDPENHKEWHFAMRENYGLSNREVSVYMMRLAQEFEALSERHDQKITSMSDEELQRLVASKKQSDR